MKYAIVHVADIHYTENEPEGVSTILKAFINDLKTQKKLLGGYELLIAFTGDIVFEGKNINAYRGFMEELNDELNEIGLSNEYRLMVPGNHDIDQQIIENKFDEYEKNIVQNITSERKFNDSIERNTCLCEKFENYELFESDFVKYGIQFNSCGKGWEIDGNLGAYCLNSALASYGAARMKRDENNLAIATRNLVSWADQKVTPLNILLMHHSINRLCEWSKRELTRLIEEHFTLCLCGHDHKQNLYYNKISQNSIICSASPLYTKKSDNIGYSIISIEDNSVDKLIYRQYDNGKFLNGISFSNTDDGIVNIKKDYDIVKDQKNLEILELKLSNALISFKNQPSIFVEPKLSKDREFNDDENLLESLITDPKPSVILAQPQFGLTCLAHHIRIEAYKHNSFWIYLDAKHTKARKIENEINEKLQFFDKEIESVNAIILDSFDTSILDHQNMATLICDNYKDIPIIIMTCYTGFDIELEFDLSKLNKEFTVMHLQALPRNKIRKIVTEYNSMKKIAPEDELVSKVVDDLKALNIHRTPLNCLTLLKVFENNFNETMINRTKLIKTVLFILFTDIESLTYTSDRPNVDHVEYLLGRFCKNLVKNHSTSFKRIDIINELTDYVNKELIAVDVVTIIDILESNNILLRFNEYLEFKHTYWIYYFAAGNMVDDSDFMNYILTDKNYVNYPEIIEFYTGSDGRREDAIQILMDDTNEFCEIVNSKIGIPEEFNPFNAIMWDPPDESIEKIRKEINEKVKNSNLPSDIKDKHADKSYNSLAPYDQSIKKFLTDFYVIRLLQSIKASSRALRNSIFVKPKLKRSIFQSIINGWGQMSKVIFWLSPALTKEGYAYLGGISIYLSGKFSNDYDERLREIFLANPNNVVSHLKDDIASFGNGPIYGGSAVKRYLQVNLFS